jgi:hypothetical protein
LPASHALGLAVKEAIRADFVRTYRSFYQLVLDLRGTSTFVDGFKGWRKVALLALELQPATRVRIIHLVRDPRGFVVHAGRHAHEGAWIYARGQKSKCGRSSDPESVVSAPKYPHKH